jgi:hypothetical protein
VLSPRQLMGSGRSILPCVLPASWPYHLCTLLREEAALYTLQGFCHPDRCNTGHSGDLYVLMYMVFDSTLPPPPPQTPLPFTRSHNPPQLHADKPM